MRRAKRKLICGRRAIQPGGHRLADLVRRAWQVVEARFGARLLVDAFDDHGAGQAVFAVLRGQAARVSQRTAYFHLGKLIEVGETDQIFTNPVEKLTEDYITGRFG